MKWLPNALSLTRVLGAPFVAAAAIQNDWSQAFLLALFLALTDFADGFLATYLNAQSKLGKDWVDPLCDFALALGVLAGYIWQDDAWRTRFVVGLVIVTATIILKSLKHQTRWMRIKNFAHGVSALYYCALAFVFLYIYASKALDPEAKKLLDWSLGPIMLLASALKRHRLREWLGSIRHSFVIPIG